MIRGIRGAITVAENSKEEIISATCELLNAIVDKNNLNIDNIISVFFTLTHDLNAEFPAVAARKLGWNYIPLLCTQEIPVPGSLQSCIRVLAHVESEKKQNEIVHVYLKDAKKLRPDLN